jgi:ABC-2 type transport system ATP-binding protein
MASAVIEASGLTKHFGTVSAVGDVSFDIRRGSVVALLGGNGAGKTTTISMLLGLLLPTAGTARILGCDMATDRARALPFMNFSSPYVDLPGELSVAENLTVYGRLYGVTNLRDRIGALANDLQLEAALKRRVKELSAGQKTRVALAKALINTPQVLILDEPTASLDPDTADWVRTMLLGFTRAHAATLFFASHNMLEVERMCDEVLMMREGRIYDRGTPRGLVEKYGRQTLEEVFLDIARGTEKVAS